MSYLLSTFSKLSNLLFYRASRRPLVDLYIVFNKRTLRLYFVSVARRLYLLCDVS
jgi:hypothetical protein